MTRARSPYAVLGLGPGADRSAVEAAYRRLIKLHHPDRVGGDPETAKDVIHAYRQLTRGTGKQPVEIQAPPLPPPAGRPWGRWALAAVAAGLLWVAPWPALDQLTRADLLPATVPAGPPAEQPVSAGLQARVAPDSAAVEAGVSEAERLERHSGDLVLLYSRSCATDLRRLPGDGLLDHCLAFDMAAAHGQAGREPWLGGEVMAARHATAALKLLEDPVLAQARLHEIRKLVERRLVER